MNGKDGMDGAQGQMGSLPLLSWIMLTFIRHQWDCGTERERWGERYATAIA